MIHWSGYWERAGGLLLAIFAGRLGSRLVCPIAAILFKWIVIGKYRPGCYRMYVSGVTLHYQETYADTSIGGAHIISVGGW